jgi:gliding motility-associated-like protein
VYKVDSVPTITNGLSACSDSDYYGVFMAKTSFSQTPTFSVSFTGQSIANEREMNDSPTWLNYMVGSTFSQRIELTLGNSGSFSFGPDTAICKGDSLTLSFPAGGSYLWNDGSTGQTNYLLPGDTLWGTALLNGCTIGDTIAATEIDIAFDVIKDTLVCQGSTLQVNIPSNLYVTWEDGSNANPRVIGNPGTYVGLYSDGVCSFIDSFSVQLYTLPGPNITDTTLCPGDSIEIVLPPGYSYLWQDGSMLQSRWFSANISIWVESYDSICSRVDTINISESTGTNLPFPIADTAICQGDIITIQLPQGILNVLWSDGTSDSPKEISSPGEWWYTADLLCETISDTFFVFLDSCEDREIFVPNSFTPNGDGINEFFLIEGTVGSDFHIYIFNRWGSKVFESDDVRFRWNGTYQGKICSEGVYAYLIEYRNKKGKYRSLHGMITLIY